MSKIKRLAGETVLYGLGSIIPRFLNFLLVPLHTDVFSPTEYGVITKVFAYVAVVNVIFMFGMETAYFRFATKPEANEKKIFNLAQTIVMAVSIPLSLLFILFSDPVATVINIPGKGNFVIWLTLIMLIDAIVAIPFARLRLQKKAILFAAGKLVNIGILVGLNVYFLKFAYTPSLGVDFVLIANLAANAFYIILFSRTLLQWRPAYDPQVTKEMSTYAYPVMITGLAGMTNEMFSRITLEAWLPKNFYPGKSADYVLGVFGACYKFAILMNLAIQAFRYAAEPFFFSHAADKNSPALFARINHYFIIVCCLILLCVSINIDILKYFLSDDKYWSALVIVPILLIANLFLGVYYNLSAWFKLTDKTYYGTIIATGGAIITIVANYILIPIAGYVGSSWATVVCYFSMTAACYVLGQKFYPIPYKIVSGLAYIFTTIAIVYIVRSITIENQWIATGFHALVISVYLVIVFLLERKSFRQALR
jgi:O-antigen/teichoic acid export membrane protein